MEEINKKVINDTPAAEQFLQSLMLLSDIKINGSNPGDIHIHNKNFYVRVLQSPSLGLGESYMDKWWECDHLDIFFDKILSEKLESKVNIPLALKLKVLFAKFVNLQTIKRAKEVALKHYDLGNDLFTAMLDSRLNYSCAYWQNANSLDDAQIAKLDLICRKLHLKAGMRLLDIGCGWGALAKYASENYGAQVIGITISKEQYQYAHKLCQHLPVEIRLQDYREINETFDCIASVGMFEHVGHLNYQTYMQIANKLLKDHGLFLLHTIGSNKTSLLGDDWLNKYIFPNGMLPSIAQIGRASESYFVLEDWHSFGAHYDKTLMAWYQNFCNHWDALKKKYDDRFYRMWRYYLLCCAGGFRARYNQLWQIVLSKNGIRGGYQSIR